MSKNINGFFTDKGNVSVKVRNELKQNTLPLVEKALGSMGQVVRGDDGGFYIEIGNANGTPIYARLELTISVKTPN
jgi:hypothetical protein